MTAGFEFELRVLLCEGCGAPVDAAPEGGTLVCQYCGAVLQLAPRVDLPELAPVAAVALAEPERLARLAAQARETVAPPAGLAAVLERDKIPPWRAVEAFAVWQSLRKRAAQGDLVASEELSYLTNKLWIGLDDEPGKQRALLESTLETLSLPRHRQLVLGALVQGAVRAGDREAAERWLARCDPRLDDLRADSGYRVARGLVASLRGDFAEVLTVFGGGPASVPLAPEWEALSCVLRGNAYLRSGDAKRASAALVASGPITGDFAAACARFPNLFPAEILSRADSAQQKSWLRTLAWSTLLTVGGFGLFAVFDEGAHGSALAFIPSFVGAVVGGIAAMAMLLSLLIVVTGLRRSKRA